MNAKQFTVALFVILLASMPLFSRPKQRADIRYAYGSTIDMQGGFVAMPYSVKGDAGKAYGAARGGEFLLRYSYFFGKHFGISAAYSFDSGSQNQFDFLRVANRADGGIYKYRPGSNNMFGYHDNSFIVSSVYRFDFARWSLRPRLGIGVAGFDIWSGDYMSFDRNNLSGTPKYHCYEVAGKPYDYIYAPNYNRRHTTCFVAAAGVQLTYSVADHFFFSAEVALKVFANQGTTFSHKVYDCKSAYDPKNWAEAVYQYDMKDQYVIDETTMRESAMVLPSSLFNINFGIGWNIGWNRNQRGRYNR